MSKCAVARCVRCARCAVRAVRGQLALEFLIIYIFFVALFAATILTIYGISARQQSAAYGVLAKAAAATLANEIAVASEFPGYEKNLSLPQTIGGLRYTLAIYNGTLLMSYEIAGANATVAHALPTAAIKIRGWNTTKWGDGWNEINVARGWAAIENINGTIEIDRR